MKIPNSWPCSNLPAAGSARSRLPGCLSFPASEKDSAIQFEPVADGLPLLEDLLTLFRRGLEQSIHFFLRSSYEYADQLLKKVASESAALARVRKK